MSLAEKKFNRFSLSHSFTSFSCFSITILIFYYFVFYFDRNKTRHASAQLKHKINIHSIDQVKCKSARREDEKGKVSKNGIFSLILSMAYTFQIHLISLRTCCDVSDLLSDVTLLVSSEELRTQP